ncbi:serine/threonine-protein kinase PknK [Polyangium aurulentum]|uniref:serine/threonine-protein kinase n=1 Tax=Polyangium aurulentum TaxID=2567896 RepID=UPI0010AE323D|nr:protein kinase [Polyangium aurulentum]UQA55930.1 protein kinase [Polyangium aurulentum]
MSEQTVVPGKILVGRYQVRRELGRGGMGVVYLCRDLVADERVAVKVLCRPGTRPRAEEAWWFHEEARALAGLHHPCIVHARDFGALADGTPFLVMDAVPGRSLHEWLYLAQEDGGLPWPLIWKVTVDVLGALGHAHARGVIHGDLKPSNILVDIPPDDIDPPTVHVLDLGLAWLMQDRVDHRLDGSPVSKPTIRWGAGTPGWMAPEQIRYAAPHVGPATDLYSLGCILFTMIAGKEPYEGTDEELLQKHKSAPLPDVPLREGIPADVVPIVRRLLNKRPWQRFEFAADARRLFWRLRPRGSDASTTPRPSVAPPMPMSLRETPPEPEPAQLDPTTTTTGLLGLRPSPFVARTSERSKLLEMAAQMAASEKPMHRFVLLAGEAGVGKSRLAEWLCEEVHERGLLVPLRARYRKIAAPLDGVGGAVVQHYRLERAERDVIEKVLMNVWDVSPEDDEGKTWVAATAEWIRPASAKDPIGPTGKRFALSSETRSLVMRRTLEHIGKERPILLMLDDLHHASPATFEGFAKLHREAQNTGLLIVGTVRDEAIMTDPVAREWVDWLLKELGGERMELPPLDSAQTHALLRETLPLDEAAVLEAAQRSKGNPLFALQVVHAWAMGGHLELRDGRYMVPEAKLAMRAATTAELWEERLRAIPEDLRRGARSAAALGTDIVEGVLRAELYALGIDAERAVAAMKRAQILLASGEERLRWPHALLQEHLLSQLFAQPDAPQVLRAAAGALAHHPAASSRRIVRHRVTNLLRAGDVEPAAALLHASIAASWGRTRDAQATLRDLSLLEGRLEGALLANHRRWRAEALRHAGRLEDCRREAEEARKLFREAGDRANEAHCLRLLGHVASDLAAPAQGKRLVAQALAVFGELGHTAGQAQCEVTLGEIDYLLGDHRHARKILASAAEKFSATEDRLGHAQCLVLHSFVEQAGGSPARARELLRTARAEFDELGYRLGMAQCDVTLAHSDHREGRLDEARSAALFARRSFRDLGNPRGQAACERLLAMAAFDAGQLDVAEEHARAAAALFDRLADPWGRVEMKLVFAQIALERGKVDGARGELSACEAVALAEAEPKQHRNLTLAWLAYHEGRFQDAAREIEAARSAYEDPSRTGDHTPQLLQKFATMTWPEPARTRIEEWQRALKREDHAVA